MNFSENRVRPCRGLKKTKPGPQNGKGNNTPGCIINKSMTHPSSLKSSACPLNAQVIQADVLLQAFPWCVKGLNGVTELKKKPQLRGIIKIRDRQLCLQ